MVEHAVDVRVRYGEADGMGVVYHPNYLLYFEVARTELLRSTGTPYADLERRGIFLVVTEATLKYRSGARYDERLQVRVRVDRVGKATVGFAYEIRGEDGRLCCEGRTDLAAVDGSKSPVRLPDEIAARLR